jgi:hypothetical protein
MSGTPERVVFEVLYNADKKDWKVIKEGAKRASLRRPTKAEAIKEAVDLAKRKPLSQVRIKTKDGRIQNEWSYPRGSDPARFPG